MSPKKELSTGGVVAFLLGVAFVVWFFVSIINALNNSSAPQSTTTSSTQTNAQVAPTSSSPQTSFGDGTFIVGTDIQPGTYHNSGESGCYYARLSGFDGTIDDMIADEYDNGPVIVKIAPTDKGFQSSGCGTWTMITVPATETKQSANDTPVSQSVNTPAKTTATPTPQPTQENWSAYQSVNFDTYYNDPQAYSGNNILVAGVFDGIFLPKGGNGGTSNYVEIGDPTERNIPKIEISIPNQNNYSLAVTDLQGGNLYPLKIYGTEATPQEFTMTNGTQLSVPVITAQRIDQCTTGYGDMQLTVVYGQTTLSEIINNCASWQTIFPANIASTVNNSTNSAPITPASSNPRYFQFGVTGTCDDNGNGEVLLSGYPYTNGYEIPTDDINTWADGEIAFTIPTSVPAGTYQVNFRGYDAGTGIYDCTGGGNITLQ